MALKALEGQVLNGDHIAVKPTRGVGWSDFKWASTYEPWALREVLKGTPNKLAK